MLTLTRKGKELAGTFTGSLGEGRPVKGTWRDGYVELSFPGVLTVGKNPPADESPKRTRPG